MKHQKHSKLVKPEQGIYSRHEISILGSNCDRINNLARSIAESMKEYFPVSYVDADHNAHSTSTDPSPFALELIDKISYREYNIRIKESTHQKRVLFDTGHLTLINGNHEQGENQIVFIDIKKESSLRKRSAKLTNVIAIIGIENKMIPDYIKELIPNHAYLPKFEFGEDKVNAFIKTFVEERAVPVNGLILGGGKSTRMGTDKIFMEYHGLPQYEYLNNLLEEKCNDVNVSCRTEQAQLFENPLVDTFVELGAYGGLLSAFRSNPNVAWFVVACDIPFLDDKTIEILFSKRNSAKMATCFYNSETEFPEPLITIWEPKSYPILLHYLSQGYSCPRKVLINNDVEIIKLQDELVLLNANTLEERDNALKVISKK